MAEVTDIDIVSGVPTTGTGTVKTVNALIDYLEGTATDPVFVNFKPATTSSGLTQTRVMSAATTNATNLKASAGNIYSIRLFNLSAGGLLLKLYNKASAPTVGSDTPIWTIPLPASGGYSDWFPVGLYFSTGISYAITGGVLDSDTTAVALNDVVGQITWI